MADSMLDIASRYGYTTDFDPYVNRWAAIEQAEKEQAATDKSSLSFTDMLSLMVAQFQYQTIDNQADTTDMMNQLVQMSSMQAMTEMTEQLKEVVLANVMSYSASLVGQYVTIGIYDSEGELTELYGQVEGTGTYNGQQVVFVEGKSYYLSSIMAVGKLPPRVEDPENPDGDNKDEGTDKVPGEGDGDGTGDVDASDKVEQNPDSGTEDSEDAGQSGAVSGVDTENEVG